MIHLFDVFTFMFKLGIITSWDVELPRWVFWILMHHVYDVVDRDKMDDFLYVATYIVSMIAHMHLTWMGVLLHIP